MSSPQENQDNKTPASSPQENPSNETLKLACQFTGKLVETLKVQLHLSDIAVVRTLLFHAVRYYMQTEGNQKNSLEEEIEAAETFAYLDVNKMIMS